MIRNHDGTDRFHTAAEIESVASGLLDRQPRKFRKSHIAQKLGIRSRREHMLLTDALRNMAKTGLISWDPGSSSWENHAV